jgi:hypothetical protein
MSQPTSPDDPREAEVVDPTNVPETLEPSTTGTVVGDGEPDEGGQDGGRQSA